MKDIQLLIKKSNLLGGYDNIYPKTYTDAVVDKESGKVLTNILSGFNCYFLSYNGNIGATRKLVPMSLRREGLWITYVLYDHTVVTEWYNSASIDDNSWADSSNWRLGNNILVGDLSISSNGKWVIDGVETEFYARGETGIAPILRIYNNKLLVSYNEGKTWAYITDNPVYTLFRTNGNKLQVSTDLGKSWNDTSDYIAAWFKWINSDDPNIGKILISRDEGKSWSDLTPNFTNNLYIKGYVSTVGDLPTSAAAIGDIYMVGPTYDESDTNHDYPHYRMWVKLSAGWADNGEFTSISAGVVQETGNSESNVMSQKATTEKLTELESEVKAGLGLPNNSYLARTLENYRLVGSGDKIFQANSGTNVLIFEVGSNTLFEIKAETTLAGACVVLVNSVSPQTYKLLHSVDVAGVYTYQGMTTDLRYVAIQVDNGAQYNCIHYEPYTSEDINNDIEGLTKEVNNDIDGLKKEINNVRYIKINSATLKRNLAGYKLQDNTAKPLITNTSTDVLFFYVGKNIKFKVSGMCSVDGCRYALVDSVSPNQWALRDATKGNYEFIGETTEELNYVAVTIDKNSEYTCDIVDEVKEVVQSQRKSIYIQVSDSQVEILEKMLEAYNQGNYDVYFEQGTYIFDDIYIYMLNTLKWTWTMELPIGNNCRYYFNGATLISNQPNEAYSESRNILGCRAGKSGKVENYELYDATLINNGGTYCVHDECSRSSLPYIHKYHNIKMQYNQGEDTEYLSKCIGGGAGINGYIVINNCIFENNNSNKVTEDVSWHGLIGSEYPISINLYVSNSYFSRSFRVGSSFKESDEIVVKYSGNSHAALPVIESYAKTFIFCNETRVI